MAGTTPHGSISPGTLTLMPSSAGFIAFLNSTSRQGRYILELNLAPIDIEIVEYPPSPIGAFANGTISLSEDEPEVPVGTTMAVSFSDGEYKTAPNDPFKANAWCEVRITDRADIERSIRLSQTASSRAQSTIGEIELADADGYIRDLVNTYTVKNQVAEVRYQPVGLTWGDGRRVYRGLVDKITRQDGRSRVTLKDISSVLDVPLLLYRYSGLGLSDGYTDIQGTYRPLALGWVKNVEPVLEDRGAYVYRFNTGPHDEIEAVMDGGATLTKAGTLPAGSDYGDLRGYTLDEGEWVDAPSLGAFKVNFAGGSPFGEVRCTGRGDTSYDGYTNVLGGIALRIIDYCGISRQLVDVDSFHGLPNYEVGYYFPGGTTPPNGEELMKALFDPILGVYGSIIDERLHASILRPPEDTTYSYEFLEPEIMDVVEIALSQSPIYSQKMLYARNWAPLSETELVSGITAEEITHATQRNPAPAAATNGYARIQNRDAIEGEEFDTLMTNVDQTVAACQMQIDFWSVRRRAFEVTLARRGVLVNQATVVRLWHRDLPNGKDAPTDGVVVRKRDDYAAENVRVTVIV